ncbi:coiled-coil domain-containing protein 43 [Coccinella septempunctata]|uniref:coiled-coil domain-containing protein 43 n=1 Tax=Coccinella septempunctata TaxID=41139 RepID=UPI001D085B3A|nr:coiled-coil domain-containing protein 43 [Coccinella septempunctata]
MASEDFQTWLSKILTDLNIDESIFGSYIIGILDSDETLEEKSEALEDLLTEIVQNAADLRKIKMDMMEKWNLCSKVEDQPNFVSEDVDTKLAKLLESRCVATTKVKEYTAEEKKIREAILSQYSQMSDEDGDENVTVQVSGDLKENLEKNTNAQTVIHAEKLKREQAKMDSQKKKEKDREDREKQKQLKEEKKEKRKTQKGERRR